MNEMNNRTMPPCTVMPVLVYPEVRQAVDWLCNAFGFVERWEARGHRAQLLVGAGAVVVVDGDATGACGATRTTSRRSTRRRRWRRCLLRKRAGP